ncbi:MAG: acyl-CoA dehydrogenase family protein [Bdellovibrionota bacterium]
MAENLFTDFPERIEILKTHSHVRALVMPLEETLGEPGSFKNADEGMEIYLGMMEELGKFAAQDLKPHAAAIDREGLTRKDGEILLPEKLREHLRKASELGVFAGAVNKHDGGLNFPRAFLSTALEMFGHGCPNTALTIAAFSMGDWFSRHASQEQKNTYLEGFLTGQTETAMALTEPGAGSDLGKLRTTAKKEGDHWILNGTKQFITNGNSDIVFTLARSDAKSEGLSGLSVFIVPKHLEGRSDLNVKVAKAEHKICLHASPTCELIYENSVGYLLGNEGEGFKVMADLMNMARLAMGCIAVGISTAALEEAKKYARNRVTMGKPIVEHPMVADMLYEMEVEIRAMRALMIESSCAFDWMQIYEKKGDTKNFKKWQKRYRRLTPLVKYLCAEKVIPITRNALQIFGGYGVCTEYPAERLFRESIIYPIYEGTSQIQSLMVLKDTLKDVASHAGGFLGSLAGAWAESKVTRDPVNSMLLQARNELNQSIRYVLMSIMKGKFKSDIEGLKEKKIQTFIKDFSLRLMTPDMDLTYPFLVAERLTRNVCDYYALKCMVDHYVPEDKEQERWILEFGRMAIPRMRLENHYMVNRLPSTLDYIKRERETAL